MQFYVRVSCDKCECKLSKNTTSYGAFVLSPLILGIDFTSAPSATKPITIAHARLVHGAALRVERLERLESLDAFSALLVRGGPWVGGFDVPFGLPRELVTALGWPTRWPELVRYFGDQPRAQLREHLVEFCAGRPAGSKFAHRATDRPAGSSPSMKWVNPPVAWMLHAAAPRLLEAGVAIPGLAQGDPSRVALEAYPGMLARAITRASYKSDDRAKQDAAREAARGRIVAALTSGRHPLAIKIGFARGLRAAVEGDPRGDWLDAVLCAVQAAWAVQQGPGFGLPAEIDPIEGWIISTPAPTG